MELEKNSLKGILPAIVTPINIDGDLNRAATGKLISFLLDAGVDGIVPLGGTGEFTNLEPKKRALFVEIVAELVGGRVPVVAGVLSPGLGDAVASAQDFKRAGADAIMLVTPFYVRPTQDGIRGYFNEFCNRIDVPVVLYDIPYRTGVAIEPVTVRRLVEENPKIIGMKACSTDLAWFTRMITAVEDKLSVLSGEEYLFLSHMILGAKGGILATCNVLPHAWIKMYNYIETGDISSARRILFRLVPLMDAVFAEMNPGPLKAVMSMVEHDVGPAMCPLVKPCEKTIAALKSAIQALVEKPV